MGYDSLILCFDSSMNFDLQDQREGIKPSTEEEGGFFLSLDTSRYRDVNRNDILVKTSARACPLKFGSRTKSDPKTRHIPSDNSHSALPPNAFCKHCFEDLLYKIVLSKCMLNWFCPSRHIFAYRCNAIISQLIRKWRKQTARGVLGMSKIEPANHPSSGRVCTT